MNLAHAAGRMPMYRWCPVPGREDASIAAWTATERLPASGSHGSRLRVGEDGWWYGYAQWPERATRDAAFAADPVGHTGMAMAGAVAASAPPVEVVPVVDLLQPAAATRRTT